MRINPVFNNPKIATNKSNPQKINRTQVKDSFCFKGNNDFRTKQKEMISAVENYILNNRRYDEKEIERIIQKFYPYVTFREETPLYQEFRPDIKAQSSQSYALLPRSNDKDELGVIPYYHKISMNFPRWNFKKDKLLFASRLIHEFTHVIQEENDPDKSVINLIDKFLSRQRGAKFIHYTVDVANGIFPYLEAVMIDIYKNALKASSNFPSKVADDKTIDMAFTLECGSEVNFKVEDIISEMKSRYGYHVDWDYIYDYLSLRAELEATAYQTELDFFKKHFNLGNTKTDFDLKIEMYKKIAKHCQELKKAPF